MSCNNSWTFARQEIVGRMLHVVTCNIERFLCLLSLKAHVGQHRESRIVVRHWNMWWVSCVIEQTGRFELDEEQATISFLFVVEEVVKVGYE